MAERQVVIVKKHKIWVVLLTSWESMPKIDTFYRFSDLLQIQNIR
jgi:hypothetical protein